MRDLKELGVVLLYLAMIFVLVRPGSLGPNLITASGDAGTNLIKAATGGGTW